MKNLKLKIAMVAVVAAVAGYGVYQNQTKKVISELTLANVEALAYSSEYGQDCTHYCIQSTMTACMKLGDWGYCIGKLKPDVI